MIICSLGLGYYIVDLGLIFVASTVIQAFPGKGHILGVNAFTSCEINEVMNCVHKKDCSYSIRLTIEQIHDKSKKGVYPVHRN